MEEREEVNAFLNNNYMANGDVYFCSFYYKALKRLLDIDSKANVSYLFRYAKIFDQYYDRYFQVKSDLEDKDDDETKMMRQQLKESLHYRILYVYRNAALFSSAVTFYFWNIYEHNPKVIKKILKKKQVKICSIGGCSIPDIVAIITVLKSVAIKSGIELDFRVTIIDFNTDWKNACLAVLSCLEEFRTATWKINFIQSNLAKSTWASEVLTSIQEADIVTMVYYFNKFNVKRNIVTMICNELESQAILFILDRPLTKNIELYLHINDLGDFHLIDVELYDYHTLDIEAVKHLRTLYDTHFGSEKLLRSNICSHLFVGVWVKASSETNTRHLTNLECMFQINEGKYDPKKSFLSNNAFTKWKNSFTKEKEAAGWNTRTIKKFVQEEEKKRNNMFGKFILQKKEVDSVQKHLLTQVQLSKVDTKEFNELNEKSIDYYLSQKKQYSEMKKTAYFTSLTGYNLCSTFK